MPEPDPTRTNPAEPTTLDADQTRRHAGPATPVGAGAPRIQVRVQQGYMGLQKDDQPRVYQFYAGLVSRLETPQLVGLLAAPTTAHPFLAQPVLASLGAKAGRTFLGTGDAVRWAAGQGLDLGPPPL